MLDHVIDGFVQVSFKCSLEKINPQKKNSEKVCQPKFIFLNKKNKKSGVDNNNRNMS